MLVTRMRPLAKRAKYAPDGMSRDAFGPLHRHRAELGYEISHPLKYNLTDIAAALGLQQLKRLNASSAGAKRSRRVPRGFAGWRSVTPPRPAPATQHSWHLYVVRLADGAPLRATAS